jgi:hypothetical protein
VRQHRGADLGATATGEADEEHLDRLLLEQPLGLCLSAKPFAGEPLGEDRDERLDPAPREVGGRVGQELVDRRAVVDGCELSLEPVRAASSRAWESA